MRKDCHFPVLALVYFFVFSSPEAFADDPNVFNRTMGLSYLVMGTLEADPPCPLWQTVHSRTGSDGGQLTIALDRCLVAGYEIEYFPQDGGAGGTMDLIPDDLIIVWDEDAGHGEDFSDRNFEGE
ncbi:MAG: hypothetical protein JW860_00605 [Sedimentisphaerales bacterium]|nr:hypothetical protein [Sedimentisphaerales bacterium]